MSKKLFSLIKSLSQTEKTHFKKVSSIHIIKGQNVYMKLFDVIDKMDEYDLSILQDRFHIPERINKLSPYSNYLFGKILDSLRIYNARNTIDSEIRYLLLDVESLFRRDLFKEAGSILTKAKNKAIKHEKMLLSIEIIIWEEKLTQVGSHLQLEKINSTKYFECMESMDVLKNSFEYNWLYNRIIFLFEKVGQHIKGEKELKELEEIMNNTLLLSEEKAITLSDKHTFFYIHELYNFIKRNRDIKKCIKFCLKRKELMENNIEFAKDQMNVYLTIFNNLFVFYLQIFEVEKMELLIQDVKAMPVRFANGIQERDENIRVAYLNSFFLVRCLISRKYEEGLAAVKGKEAEWERVQDKIGKKKVMVYYNHMRALSFLNQDFKKALFWNNKILNSDSRIQDHYTFALIWEIIIHYNLGNFELIEKRVVSFNRLFMDPEESNKFEYIFLKNIQKILHASYESKAAVKNGFTVFKKELRDFKSHTREIVRLDYVTPMAWIDSHIENKRISETIKKYFKRHL